MNIHKRSFMSVGIVGLVSAISYGTAQAVTFDNEYVRGSFDSTVSVGFGVRTKSPSCGLVTAGATGTGAPEGCLGPVAGLFDQGDLNYGRGDPFTTYLKGSHELLLKMPSEITFMARATWLRDFSATQTTGITSGTIASGVTPTPSNFDSGLTPDAREDLRFKARLLDLWVSKGFAIGDQQARLRVGNQVVNWGESLFQPGGINSTNAYDAMRLSQPGTQLKEAVLPAPMISLATGLGGGFNVEAYVQSRWNETYVPPVGSYWSTTNGLGKGSGDYGYSTVEPRKTGQWGVALRYQPRGTQLNLGVYAMNFHDKVPQITVDQTTFTQGPWTYAEDRRLFGISANFPVGDWAVGTELSYRPKDAVSLNPLSGCVAQNGKCWVDERRFQWHLNGLLSLTPSNAGSLLKLLGADTATFLVEGVVIRYPKLKQDYSGSPVAAGYWGWGNETNDLSAGLNPSVPTGTKTSSGINLDFSWTYDGTLIPGWQVVPEILYFQALSGRTPNVTAQFMKGAKSVNFVVNFIQNPASWQATVNYARFMGGQSPFDQPLRDRDFVGFNLSRNF